MRGLTDAKAAPGRSNRLLRLARSSIGGKWIMALTGAFLIGFLVMHMSGNLLVFAGPEAINGYAEWLRDNPAILWGGRIGLLVAFVLHIAFAFKLTAENKAARPERYRYKATVQASWASRYMILTGALVAAYVVYHLAHFTFHAIDTGGMDWKAGEVDVYSMVVAGFRNPLVSLSYIVAQGILFLHLWHATGSMFQTLGWTHSSFKSIGRPIALALPVIITAGFVAVPLAVWFGVVR